MSVQRSDGQQRRNGEDRPVAIMMALFGLLWLMRIRAEVRKDKRKRCSQSGLDEQHLLLPPPVSFADARRHSIINAEVDDALLLDALDASIPPPPPPPLRQNVQIHRSSSIREGLHQHQQQQQQQHYPAGEFFRHQPAAQSFSRSAQNLPLECTCPTGRPIRRQAVRFCDDPFGFYSARGAQSWNYSTLPRTRPNSRSAHG